MDLRANSLSDAGAQAVPRRDAEAAKADFQRAAGAQATTTKVVTTRALVVPDTYEDFTQLITHLLPRVLSNAAGVKLHKRVLVRAVEVLGTRRPWVPGRSINGVLLDEARNRLAFAAPDSAVRLQTSLRAHGESRKPVLLYGRLERHDGRLVLIDPEPVQSYWLGRLRPVYRAHHFTSKMLLECVPDLPGDCYLAPAYVQNEYRRAYYAGFDGYARDTLSELLVKALKTRRARRVALGVARVPDMHMVLSQILRLVHFPKSQVEALKGREHLDHIAAVSLMHDLVAQAVDREQAKSRKRWKTLRLEARAKADYRAYAEELTQSVPFALTKEQITAVVEALRDIDGARPMHRVLSGDVGSGKTVVFCMIAKAILLAGGRVAVLTPTFPLVEQTARKLAEFIPEVPCTMVVGNSGEIGPENRLCIGTVALNSRAGDGFDLVIIDEQQRFSKTQREDALRAKGHIYEASATPIPRTTMMTILQGIKVSRLFATHVRKDIRTRIWPAEQRAALFVELSAAAAAAYKIMAVYPAVESSDDRLAIQDVQKLWSKHFGQKVRVVLGSKWMTDEDRSAALEAFRTGEATILVCTTVVEVGIDIPDVKRVAIMQADRFGIQQLHQLRGRAARAGGVGHCDLFLTDEVSGSTMERLESFVRESDGFKLALDDMDRRGAGDATEFGIKQKGQPPKNPFTKGDIPMAAIDRACRELYASYEKDIEEPERKAE